MRLRPGEQLVARIRPHGRALFWPTLVLLGTSAALGFFAGRLPEEWQNLAVVAIGAVVLVVGWVLPLVRWAGRRYLITTQRTVLSGGVLVRHRREVPHAWVLEVTVRRGVVQSVVGSGDVILGTAGSSAVLRDIPTPALVADALLELVDEDAGQDEEEHDDVSSIR